MSKTVAISDDIHILITKKQTEMFEKYRITTRISDLVNLAIKFGIDNAIEAYTPKEERLKIVEEKDVKTR